MKRASLASSVMRVPSTRRHTTAAEAARRNGHPRDRDCSRRKCADSATLAYTTSLLMFARYHLGAHVARAGLAGRRAIALQDASLVGDDPILGATGAGVVFEDPVLERWPVDAVVGNAVRVVAPELVLVH